MAWQVFDCSKKVYQEKTRPSSSGISAAILRSFYIGWNLIINLDSFSRISRALFSRTKVFPALPVDTSWIGSIVTKRVFLVCFTTKQSPTQLFASSLTKSQSRLITNFSKRENKTRKTDSLSLLCWSFLCLIQLSHDRTQSLRSLTRVVSTDKKRYKKF